MKDFYLDVLPAEPTEIMYPESQEEKVVETKFELPTFSKKEKVTGAEIGSAVHELMQRIPLKAALSQKEVKQALQEVSARNEVKKKIDVERIYSFFQTEFGQNLILKAAKVKREAPFAMIVNDPVSKEDFVVRGIIDGYLLEEDKITLYDFKTDFYRQPQELVERYRKQMALYAQALQQAYGIENVEKHLVLLGTSKPVQIVKVD
jgi:ATP-dependent helicase/nuclease subunit A